MPMSVMRPLGLAGWCAGLGVRGNVSEHPVVVSSRRVSTLMRVGRPGGAVSMPCVPLREVGCLVALWCVWCVATAEGRRVASRRVGGGGPGVPGVC